MLAANVRGCARTVRGCASQRQQIGAQFALARAKTID
jgi:hypothetical protein